MNDRQARYMASAYDELIGASLDDFLRFLTVRRVAGSGTARFYDAFPRGDASPGGREELLSALQDDATRPDQHAATAVTAETVLHLLELQAAIKDRNPAAIDGIKRIALDDFDSYFGEGVEQEPRELLRTLMVVAAGADPEARQRVGQFYEAITRSYVGIYKALLAAVGREPIPSVGGVENFASIISALYDGLRVQARIDDPDRARELLASALIPLITAITMPVGTHAPDEAELLFGAEEG